MYGTLKEPETMHFPGNFIQGVHNFPLFRGSKPESPPDRCDEEFNSSPGRIYQPGSIPTTSRGVIAGIHILCG